MKKTVKTAQADKKRTAIRVSVFIKRHKHQNNMLTTCLCLFVKCHISAYLL